MKTLKQRFTRWFNRCHERRGTLWEELAAEELITWRKAAYHYRQILYLALNRDRADVDAEEAPQISEAEALMCRARFMSDGMALGTVPFIENIFGWCRALFGEKRKSGARKLRGIDTPLRTLRDLGRNPGGT